MITPINLAVSAVVLCLGLAVLAGEPSRSQPASSPGERFDPASLKALEVFRAVEATIGPDGFSKNPDADWGWSESRVLMAYQAMYEATGDEQYLTRLLEHIDRVLAARGDRRGLNDEIRGKMMPGWITTGYTEGKRHAYLVHAGMIVFPMARCAAIVLPDSTLAAKYGPAVRKIFTDVAETLAAYEEDWREGPNADEGYYYCPVLKTGLPFNQQNALGRAMVAMYLATGKDSYRQRAEKLARFFKRRLKIEEDRYSWDYWPQRPGAEDTSHASINVDFAFQCYRAGIVFDAADMNRFVATLRHITLPDGFADFIDGQRTKDGVLGLYIGGWAHLCFIDPALREPLVEFLATKGKAAGPVTMMGAAYIVETQRPVQQERPATAPVGR
jgi:hypothetical protein